MYKFILKQYDKRDKIHAHVSDTFNITCNFYNGHVQII